MTQDPSIPYPHPKNVAQHLQRFLSSPARIKYLFIRRRLRLWQKASPFRLGFGPWWLPDQSPIDSALRSGVFENAEVRFVSRLVKPGWCVLDIGAHHGFYSLLACELVGPTGRVVSFEPSPRERRRLEGHLQLNKFANAIVRSEALGEETGEAELYLVDGQEDWCNSLRPPDVNSPVSPIKVPLTTLDEFLKSGDGRPVDFIKLDVEGGELAVLKGAARLWSGNSRPVLLVEIRDERTSPWGYPSKDIIDFLHAKGYVWYSLNENGSLAPLVGDVRSSDVNFVAWPKERISAAESLLG